LLERGVGDRAQERSFVAQNDGFGIVEAHAPKVRQGLAGGSHIPGVKRAAVNLRKGSIGLKQNAVLRHT
jgi:hypothetical protein